MKFFSNEAKENTDDPGPGEDRDRVDVGVAAVPTQRAGSPWSDAPADAAAPTGTPATGTPATDSAPDGTPATDSAPGGTAPAAAAPADPAADPAGRERRDGAGNGPWAGPAQGHDQPGERPEAAAIRDEGTLDSPTVVEPATGRPVEDQPASAAIRDEGTFDSPTVVEPATGQRLEQDAAGPDAGREEDGTGDRPGVVEPAAVTTPATFFPDGDSFAERFRDIQLRFVDHPKDATAEAAALVDEAVDRLTSALKDQRGGLGTGSDDTEKLRIELRGYRDLLNRLTAL